MTGSECTGKTTLVGALAKHYRVPFTEEGARKYVEKIGRSLNLSDVELIAQYQIDIENRQIQKNSAAIVLDTDLFSTVVYSKLYFGCCPAWIVETARKRKADLYLICSTDIPWAPDGLQRDRGTTEERNTTHLAFLQELKRSACTVEKIGGLDHERLQCAFMAIKTRIGEQIHLVDREL